MITLEAIEVEPLTDDELNLVVGGSDPEEGGQFHVYRSGAFLRVALNPQPLPPPLG